jgi:RimJ/RimL family protein N-acetyltransferase
MSIAIVPITPEYVEGFHRALDIVARERKYLVLLEAPSLEHTRDFVSSIIERGDVQVVALAQGEVVGWRHIRRHPFPAQAHRGTLGMGVVPAHRGRGRGSRLIEAALARAHAADFVRIELDVYEDNAPAIALYERTGFVREGVVRAAVLIDGEYRDAIAMARVEPRNLA